LSALDLIKVSLNIRETGLAELSTESAYTNLKRAALEIEKYLGECLKLE
jgi:hypothetical protein